MPDAKCIDDIADKIIEKRAKMTDEELDAIAERLEQRIYQSIGKGIVNRFLWVVGILTVSILTYLDHKDII